MPEFLGILFVSRAIMPELGHLAWRLLCYTLGKNGVGERRTEGLNGWPGTNTHLGCKRRSMAFRLAMTPLAGDDGMVGIPVQLS